MVCVLSSSPSRGIGSRDLKPGNEGLDLLDFRAPPGHGVAQNLEKDKPGFLLVDNISALALPHAQFYTGCLAIVVEVPPSAA